MPPSASHTPHRATRALLVSAALTIALAARQLLASDRGDLRPQETPAADIADVYSFVAPVPDAANPGTYLSGDRLVLAMTVMPNASPGATFATDVEYLFRIRPTADGRAQSVGQELTLACRFDAFTGGSQRFFCNINGFFFAGQTDAVPSDASAPLRVFAGRRKDPSSGGAEPLVALTAAGAQLPASPATNSHAGQAVLAIVAEVDMPRVLFRGAAVGARPLVAVSAQTSR